MNPELFWNVNSPAGWILCGLFVLGWIIQLGFYLLTHLRFARYQARQEDEPVGPVSVVICARNEMHNLERFLPLILEQDYPEYEVVVVNDASLDESEMLLSNLSARYSHLRYTSIPANEKFTHGKKLAVTVGLKAASYENILLTDADCRPEGADWIRLMVSGLKDEKEIVLGYGKYEQRRGLLNILIRYETAFTAMQYFALALKGKAYMGVGRNLAYRKELFFTRKGFSSHYHIPSGDDDLFVNENANTENTCIEVRPGSHTISLAGTSFSAWFRQKKRHILAGSHYNRASRRRIGLEILSRFTLYTAFILLMSFRLCMLSAGILFLLFEIVRMIIFNRSLRHLNERYLLLPSLLLDPLLPVLLAVIRLSNLGSSKKQAWK